MVPDVGPEDLRSRNWLSKRDACIRHGRPAKLHLPPPTFTHASLICNYHYCYPDLFVNTSALRTEEPRTGYARFAAIAK